MKLSRRYRWHRRFRWLLRRLAKRRDAQGCRLWWMAVPLLACESGWAGCNKRLHKFSPLLHLRPRLHTLTLLVGNKQALELVLLHSVDLEVLSLPGALDWLAC